MQSRLARLALVFVLMVAPAWAWAAYAIHDLKSSCGSPPCHYIGDPVVLITGFIAGLGAIPALMVLAVVDRRRAKRSVQAI